MEKKQILLKEKIGHLTDWIENQVKTANKKGVIFGLSGGIDSALIAGLCQRAFPDNTLALIMPCESQKSDLEDAMAVINQFSISCKTIELTTIYQDFLAIMGETDHKMAKSNIKPRLRMIALYYFANILDYLVVGTGNKSEISIGYSTKYGDGGVDILPLGNTLKTEVKEMAKYMKVPEKIITKPPSAGLWKDQTDEKEMGFTYTQLDHYLMTGQLEDENLKQKIAQMCHQSKHKRKMAPIPDF